MLKAKKIRYNNRDMYSIVCKRCGKKIISFGEKQAIRNMDVHLISCKGNKNNDTRKRTIKS